jgi:hypothetical protein
MNKLVVLLIYLSVLFPTSIVAENGVVEQTLTCKGVTGATPEYSIARKEHGGDQRKTLHLQISVSPKYTTSSAAMVALGCKLAISFPSESSIDVLIFDQKNAARNLALYATDQTHWGEYIWHLRAHYHADRINQEQFIDWLFPEVDPNDPSRLFRITRYHITMPLQP